MQAAELFVLDWIQTACRCRALDVLMPAASLICNHGEVWIALTVVLLIFRRTRRTGCTLAAALILDLIFCNIMLKPMIARIRPCDVNAAVQLLIARPSDFSFPSGHAASSFTATAALKASGSRLWLPAFFLAVLISFSRLYLYVHWPSDILAGAILGTVLGFLGWRLTLLAEAQCRLRKN